MTQNPSKKRTISQISDKIFREAAESSSDILTALRRMDAAPGNGNVRKFRKRAKAMGLKLAYLKTEPEPPQRHRSTRLQVPMADLVGEPPALQTPEGGEPVTQPTRSKKRPQTMKEMPGSIEEKIKEFPLDELQKHITGATSLRQVFLSIGQDRFGGNHSILLRDRIIETGLDYSDLQSVVRHRISMVPDEEFKEIVEGFESLENVASYIGIPRLTPYVEKVLKTRIKEMQLKQGLDGKRDPRPAPPAPPGEPEPESKPEPAKPTKAPKLSPVVELLMEDEEELKALLRQKVTKLEEELEEVHREIEEAQERRNALVKKINKLNEALR